MTCVTGDTHGNQVLWDACIAPFMKTGDMIIVAGDFGLGFFDGKYWPEEMFFDYLAAQNYTTVFCDGNHEDFEKISGYAISEWNGGKVHRIRENVIHLMRGEIFEIDGKSLFVMGGGYSIDKDFRVQWKNWWAEEMPNNMEYERASRNLALCGYKVDYILTHTAPANTVEYMSRMNMGIKNTVIEESPLTGFLQWVEEKTEYKKWFFGHFHIDRELWKNQIAVLDAIRDLETGEILKMRMPSVY